MSFLPVSHNQNGQQYWLYENKYDDGAVFFEALNDSGKVVINSSFCNFSLEQKLTGLTMSTGLVTIPTGQGGSPLFAIYCANPAYCIQSQRTTDNLYIYIRNLTETGVGTVASGTDPQLTVWRYGWNTKNLGKSSLLRLYDAKRGTVFNSSLKYARIVDTDNGYPMSLGQRKTYSHNIAIACGAPVVTLTDFAVKDEFWYAFPDSKTFRVIERGQANWHTGYTLNRTTNLIFNVDHH